MMNGLFGKFSQAGLQWTDREYGGPVEPFALWYGINPDTGEPCRWRSIAGNKQFEESRGTVPDYAPAITAWVNSLGRVRLLQWIEIAGWENVYYVDTDSLWTNSRGRESLDRAGEIRSGEMGFLSDKGCYPWVEFIGHKHYRTPDRYVCAGLPKWDGYMDNSGYRFWSPERIGESIRRRQEPGRRVLLRTATGPGEYRHGVTGRDGTVNPIRISEESA